MSRSLTSLGLGVLFVLCCGVSSVQAEDNEESPKIGIFPVQATVTNLPQREVRRFSMRLSQKLAAAGAQIIRKYPLIGGRPPTASAPVDLGALKQKDLGPVRTALQAGEAKLQAQDIEASIKPLRLALQTSTKHMRWPETYELFTSSLASLALAYLQIGRNDIGEALLKNLARLSPNPLPKAIQSSRPMRFRYKRASREVSSIKKTSLKLVGTSGADVYVNGSLRGKLPLEVSDLYEGYTYIRVTMSGHLPEGAVVQLKEGMAAQRFDLKTSAPVQRVAPMQATKDLLTVQVQKEAWDAPAFIGAARDVCEKAKLSALVTGLISPLDGSNHRFHSVRYDCRTQKVLILKPAPIQNELQDADTVLAKLAPQLVKPPEPPKARIDNTEPPPDERRKVAVITRPPVPGAQTKPVHQQWWFWTIIGVAVVGGGVTAAYFLLQPPKMNFSATWDPNFNSAQ
ncbi:MAG: hypothetical protein H6728_07780 [Myxococcales bacterium]|nr:hypothetical protein [Myxococcales bacterium]